MNPLLEFLLPEKGPSTSDPKPRWARGNHSQESEGNTLSIFLLYFASSLPLKKYTNG